MGKEAGVHVVKTFEELRGDASRLSLGEGCTEPLLEVAVTQIFHSDAYRAVGLEPAVRLYKAMDVLGANG